MKILVALYTLATLAASVPAVTAEPPVDFISTGGAPGFRMLCPKQPNDVIVPLSALNPGPKEGEMEMTVEGVDRFIREHNIHTIEQLMAALPLEFRTNFSLVEHTRATGESNLTYPRIVSFGADAHFMLNIGTKADDPKYQLLDVMEFHEDTGHWELSMFDFNGKKPKLTRNDPSCNECHGRENARPVWGTNMLWTGVIGDNEAAGPNGEALSGPHAIRLNEIKAGKGGNPRFDYLVWNENQKKFGRGAIRHTANNAFGAELLISNYAMGTATARGAYVRLKNANPTAYPALQGAIIQLGIERYQPGSLSALSLSKIHQQVQLATGNPKATPNTLDELLALLGIDTREAFSVATLHDTEEPDTSWSLGGGDLYDLLLLQVLDDLAKKDTRVNNILTATATTEDTQIFGCADAARNIAQVIEYKMLQLFYLQGRARYDVQWVYYPRDAEHIKDRVFKPVQVKLNAYLAESPNTHHKS